MPLAQPVCDHAGRRCGFVQTLSGLNKNCLAEFLVLPRQPRFEGCPKKNPPQ